MGLDEDRQRIRRMFDLSNPADAPTAYYALFHDPARSVVVVHADNEGRPNGFAGRFQTGLDLFRPLVTLRCPEAESAVALLDTILSLGRPYILFADSHQRPWVGGCMEIMNERMLAIYALLPAHFRPTMNVLLQRRTAPDGTPYFVIESNDQRAVSGLNWRSPTFAEIYVHTDAPARRQGWGKSVASAMTHAVLDSGRLPLYLVEEDNDVSRRLAESLGYVDTGARQVSADVIYTGVSRA